MSNRQPRVGIERKILTSILWVGILPMAVALIVGYLSARRGASEAVRETLQVSAQTTSEGIRRDIVSRLDGATHLAAAEVFQSLLDAGAPPSPAETALISWMAEDGATDEDSESVLSLYDDSKTLVHSTGAGTPGVTRLPAPFFPSDPARTQIAGFAPGPSGFVGTVIAPVFTRDSEEVLGYLTVASGMNSIMEFALKGGPSSPENLEDRFQVIIIPPSLSETAIPFETAIALRMDFESSPPSISAPPIQSASLKEMLGEQPDTPGSRVIRGYPGDSSSPPQDVLLAYHPLLDIGVDAADMRIYFATYRPTAVIFSPINRIATMALVGCILFIAVLCVNAYRDVHNNIVRPVSLLNEGAQIIRQGDFDLKLKIGTGDEIEELASSFNKMAAALSKNVEQLESSEENYRNLVTSMRDGIYQTDAKGCLTFLNPEGMEILGFDTLDDAMGQDLGAMFIDPIAFDAASSGSDLSDGEDRSRVWMQRADNRTLCVELNRNRLFNEHGEAVGMDGLIRDVTKSVKLEEEARQRSERISAINQIANVINSSLEAGRLYESLIVELKKLVAFDYASVALLSDSGIEFDGRQLWPEEEAGAGYTFVLDGQHSFAAWVARERRCLVLGDLKAENSPFSSQFPEDIRSCLCVPLYATGRIIGTLNLGAQKLEAFSQASVETLEQMAPHLAVAIRNAQLLVNLQLSLEEVTRARERLYEANEELKTLDELKTNLLSNVSHELRTPLVSVMGYTDMILNGKAGPINRTQEDYLEISFRNVEKLVTLIENLLDFSRMHRGDERLVFDAFDLIDCAKTSMQIVQPLADGCNVRVLIQAPEGPIMVDGDKGKMGQVFNNLLSNAVKFNSSGGTVTIEFISAQRTVEVRVKDTGIGIPKDALDKVFTRFYQFDASSTRRYGGTGIGLAIAQDIMRLHGSSILVESEPGAGSTFRFTLGRAVPEEEIVPGDIPEVSESAHVLVELVSEDRALSAQVRDFLSVERIDTIHATSLEGAIAMIERHRPNCVLLDINDTADSEAFLQSLLGTLTDTHLPVVLLTNDDDLYEKYRAQVSARVKRSFRKSSLLSGIHNALSRNAESEPPIGERILCIDDDPEILSFMRRCLEGDGFSVEQCSNGEKGLEFLAQGGFGLVFLDVAMPGMDGWETCERIKADAALKGIKVYLVTAKPIERDMGRLSQCGADGYLLKPFRPEDLVQLAQSLEFRSFAK